MQKAVSKLKIGSRVLLGSYTAGDGTPAPIIWLKATPNCDFISEYALDFLCFDAREPNNTSDDGSRGYGNHRYSVSNILSFANSEHEQWYTPMHEADNAPKNDYRSTNNRRSAYADHKGFLYHFDNYEVASIVAATYIVGAEQVTSLIRLPTTKEIIGDDRFNLFSKKGVRPKPTDNLINNKCDMGFGYTSFIPFWCADSQNRGYSTHVKIIDRAGFTQSITPSDGCGFRPVCTINPNIVVEEIGDGRYQIVPFSAGEDSLCTDEELFALLGLSLPSKVS